MWLGDRRGTEDSLYARKGPKTDMGYALATLWYERQRFLPGVLAVAFSALLIALQCGLLLGLFSITSMPIDHTRADIWMGAPSVLSIDLGRPINTSYLARVAAFPEVSQCEVYIEGFSYWGKPNGGSELCLVIGSRLEETSIGRVAQLTPELCARLSEPQSIVVDESDLKRLGISGVGEYVEVNGQRVHVVGLTEGCKSLAGPYVFCSVSTAQPLVRMQPFQATYVLARCHHRDEAAGVVHELRRKYDTISAFTSEDFSRRSRLHWLIKTKAGIALGCAAALGLLVGAVVTSQTLYAAVAGSLREYAVLRALGIPRWRMARMVMAQSLWVGLLGVAVALPASHGLAYLANVLTVTVLLPWWLQLGAASLTLVMALASGLLALRSLRLVEPALLLR
jgi:putative ABC transport system permease protein